MIVPAASYPTHTRLSEQVCESKREGNMRKIAGTGTQCEKAAGKDHQEIKTLIASDDFRVPTNHRRTSSKTERNNQPCDSWNKPEASHVIIIEGFNF